MHPSRSIPHTLANTPADNLVNTLSHTIPLLYCIMNERYVLQPALDCIAAGVAVTNLSRLFSNSSITVHWSWQARLISDCSSCYSFDCCCCGYWGWNPSKAG